MKVLYLFIISVFLMSSSCGIEISPDEELTLNKQGFTGNQLKINGYYYFKSGNDLYDTFILYRNGVILSGGGNAPDTDPFIFIENLFNSYQNNNSYQEKKSNWGLFVIDNNIICMEKWHPSSGGGMPVYKRTGEILNDTTFIITKMIRSSTGNEVSIDETFHFKKFSPKPDSTNSFIE